MAIARTPRFRAARGRRGRPSATLALLGALVLLLAACPADVSDEVIASEPYECPPEQCDPPEPDGPGGELVVEAGEFFFEIVEATVAEGTIEVTLINVGGADHNFVIDDAVGESTSAPPDSFLPPGETTEGELELFAGEYVFYCSVPGHRAQGMEGVLEVPPEPEEMPEVDPDGDADDDGEDDDGDGDEDDDS